MATIYKLNEYTNKRNEENVMTYTELQEVFDLTCITKEDIKEMGVVFLDNEQIEEINFLTKDIYNDRGSYEELKEVFDYLDVVFEPHHTYYEMYMYLRNTYYNSVGMEKVNQIEDALLSKVRVEDNELTVEITETDRIKAIEELRKLSVFRDPDNLEIYSDKTFMNYRDLLMKDLMEMKIINEFYYQDLFKKHYKSFLPLAELVKRKNNPKHIPDAWLKENGEYIPVEVKLEKFGARALKQLNRYMEFYDCKNGIAVADELTVELPDNIQFINNKDLESLNK